MKPSAAFRRLAGWLFLLLVASAPLGAAPEKDSTVAITQLVQDFLKYNTDPAQHDRFWADDLVYTSSAGLVKRKPEIMEGIKSSGQPRTKPAEAPSAYSAEDIQVRTYGDSAALTFRLVAITPEGTRLTYRNSGMFVHRDNRWQAVTWQATKEPAH